MKMREEMLGDGSVGRPSVVLPAEIPPGVDQEVHMLAIGPRAKLAAIAALGLLLAACSHASVGAASSPSTHDSKAALSLSTDSVNGLGTVLATSKGLTLYHDTQDRNGTIACTASCAATWPPVLVHGPVPQLAGVPSSFGSVKRPDGTTQLTFAGMPLYTYTGDTAPAQAAGEGLQGIWFAVGPHGMITTMSAGGGTSTSGGTSASGNASSSGARSSSGGTSNGSGSSTAGGGGVSSWG
jgi:predicted lipoprotein with Yx(FWY)xxD motif